MSRSPDWLLFLLLCSLNATDVAQDRHVVDTDSSAVSQQAEGFTAEHGPVQLVPSLGHTDSDRPEFNMVENRLCYNDVIHITPWALSAL